MKEELDDTEPRQGLRFHVLDIVHIGCERTLGAARAIRELIPPGPPNTSPQRNALKRIARSFVAGILASVPPNLPTAVRPAATMTMSMLDLLLV